MDYIKPKDCMESEYLSPKQRRPRMAWFLLIFIITIACFLLPAKIVIAQKHTTHNGKTEANNTAEVPSLPAFRLPPDSSIQLDGKLDEAIWQKAPIATGFTQRTPDDGKPATEKTEVRVLYTSEALYVGAKAYDSAMDSVAATLFRRDGDAYSDWIYVNIDSYNDHRTSFSFAVNPRGVQKDILTYNDTNEDLRWDAVWEAKTQIDAHCWTVEMRIPLSQLRYDSKKDIQTWGVNFQRRIARKAEISLWSPTPQDASGLVSRYGKLQGLKEVENPARLEVVPYASSKLSRAAGNSSNPFYSRNDLTGSLGADLKYGLTSNFTLTATVNPDFGQVEADPAVINLSAYETYFDEQRPFFLEGTDIFNFGHTETFNTFGNPIIFYSRRIGRQPHGSPRDAGIDASFSDIPDQTTIASAAKVSGKTQNGLSVGVLNAFTVREKAHYMDGNNQQQTLSVEPPANYFVGRIKQDFKGGATVLGGYLSSVNRFTQADYLKNELHQDAYIGGVDFEHSWNDREWVLSGVFSGTSVSGTADAITQTQQSSDRYYNRVDADYLSVDPGKTSLSGYAGELSFVRYGGTHWRGSLTYSDVSPGYEVNDIGFENRADYHALSYLMQYRNTKPSAPFDFYNFNVYATQAWNYGGDLINNSFGANTNVDLSNLWSFNISGGFNGKRLNDRLLRGGPITSTPVSYYYSAVIRSNKAKMISFNVGHLRSNDRSGGYERDFFVDLMLRPTSYIQLTISPDYNLQKHTAQYLRAMNDVHATQTYGKRYVLADINQTQLSTSFRLDWTFTNTISLQTYIRPFISSGNYSRFKEFRTPGTYDFDVYGDDKGSITETNGVYTVDPDGNGPSGSFAFNDPDFNYRAVQTNAVFRWQYKPGAALFLVWQQERSANLSYGNFRFRRDINGLLDAHPSNVFLVKFSYWFGT